MKNLEVNLEKHFWTYECMKLEIHHTVAYTTDLLRRRVVEPYRLQLLLLCLRTLFQGIGAIEGLP